MTQAEAAPKTYFLSHSSADDALVAKLATALGDLGAGITIDSRAFRGCDPLESTIFQAIADSAGLLVLVSAPAFGSAWVGKELKYALKLQEQRGGPRAFPVVPLLVDGAAIGVFGDFFDEAPLHIALASTRLEGALHPILVGLGLRLPTELTTAPQPTPEPVEELLLTLTEPALNTDATGRRRAKAKALLTHVPADASQRQVRSRRFTLEAPLGVIEADDLRWYLEHFATWPSPLLGDRAKRIEAQLAHWGRMLHEAAMPAAPVAEVLKSWAAVKPQAARRFSVEVDAAPEPGAADEQNQREAATELLGLPWELLHAQGAYLFQGAAPVRVRRRLPNEQVVPPTVLTTPIRVLLVSPRPEEQGCGYIDHRASALPLVQATEALGGQVQIQQLQPPTLPALRKALDAAAQAGQAFHVLHFDGHGVYQRHTGLGALCFEHPEDVTITQGPRRMALVDSQALGALLKDHGVPLVFLEACQTAMAERASESVASALLKTGVGSVVAMSHSVLVESSRRFVEAFYGALSQGARVGSAMLAGQRELHDNSVRGRLVGGGDFHLQDWFVPVLYQDQADPQLFHHRPTAQAQEDLQAGMRARQGALPPEPREGFVGRSRELLTLERLLHQAAPGQRWAVLRGQGGEGKTALAVEYARWSLRARQVQRLAFVSVEQHSHVQAVLDSLGQQLSGPQYSVAVHASQSQALQPIERALREQPTLLVIDNMESVLAPPFAQGLPDAGEAAQAILALAQQMLRVGNTHLIFTSREALPAPFDDPHQLVELQRLTPQDAVRLVERSMGLEAPGQSQAAQAQRDDIEALVDAVHGHARTLSLLAPSLRRRGPAATQADLTGLMADMQRRFPGQREHSLLASVELSLRRLSAEQREQVKVLAVFQGGLDLNVLRSMMDWSEPQVHSLAQALVNTGLATSDAYTHLSLDPALSPFLAAELSSEERQALTERWAAATQSFVKFLDQQQRTQTEKAAPLVLQELPNLLALLDRVKDEGDVAATIALCTSLYELLQYLNRPRALQQVAEARDTTHQALAQAPWSHAHFEAARTRIDQRLANGQIHPALEAAKALHQQSLALGASAYRDADYDVAGACLLLGRALRFAAQASTALPVLYEAERRFNDVERREPGCGAAGMASASITEQGDALCNLGRLDEAASAYERSIGLAKVAGRARNVALSSGQLGTVRLYQRRWDDALQAHEQARQTFEALREPSGVATAWHQIGIVNEMRGMGGAAELAYRESLTIKVRLDDLAGQASSLGQLGNLYAGLDQPKQAVIHYRQALSLYESLKDLKGQGLTASNLANSLLRLGHMDEARAAAKQSLGCKQSLGHEAAPWKTYDILGCIETAAGQPTAAQAARQQARALYGAYRREGGENHSDGARFLAAVEKLVLADDLSQARDLLEQLGQSKELPAYLAGLLPNLHAIVEGARNPDLADAPALHYTDAVEIELLLERLASAGR